ncbi:MAG: cell division protein ZapA [Limnochordia bacterium]
MSGPEAKNKAQVQICGDEYVIKGAADSEYIVALAAMVDEKMRDIQRRNPTLPRHRIAILAAINLADELTRARRENQELVKFLEELK